MTERIQLYKVKKVNIKFFMWFSLFAFAYGLFLFILGLSHGFKFDFPGDWSSIAFMAQGLIFALIAYQQWYRGKYFIELDNDNLSYQLPDSKRVVSILISDIKQIKMDGIEMFILANGSESKILFEHIEWKELNRVKALVKDLSARVSQNNV
ncbi:hypothetical protein [Ancylomarina sp. 16SWW S1-10-2]|uniref:hypothetical protein n=1 Tax=Ancylomarina sp. 16SWW S1-10-2 TaxID=2499681 RepID=UPI0012ADAEB1|nr:hypothetical protein [Ancylomarina sp. 16SWW S1-10-2]MRT92975.1 hypothetical protein [Ancylomarina sp. 16SWW S1-10-2]